MSSLFKRKGFNDMKEKKCMFKVILSVGKKEAFLQKMNEKGWKLASYRWGIYTFKRNHNEYKTVLYYADRMNHLVFEKNIAEQGCEIVYKFEDSYSGFTSSRAVNKSFDKTFNNYILYILNIPKAAKNLEYLTDTQSKIESRQRININRRKTGILLLVGFLVTFTYTLFTFATYISQYYREGFVSSGVGMFIANIFIILLMIISGTGALYYFLLYFQTKKEIKELSAGLNPEE